MRKIFVLTVIQSIFFIKGISQTELRGVTFGIGTGFSRISNTVYDYSLSPDTSNALRLQALSKNRFVISSVVTVKFGKIGVEKDTGSNKTRITNFNKVAKPGATTKYDTARFWNRIALNIALNLLEVNSENLSFNKSIDGGLGIGYFLNEFTQIAFFVDLIRVRQLRNNIVTSYENKPIPNGKENYNALDINDDKLFYGKTFEGFSIKVIFSLGNKKESSN
jgi:hypothetical protein